MTEQGQKLIERWWPVVIVLVGWLITVGMTYERVDEACASSTDNETRISTLERNVAVMDAKLSEILRRAERIESKLDR